MAKEIAFIKISPLIIKHYDPDYEAKEVEQPTAPKKQYSRRGNTTVPCDPPDEYWFEEGFECFQLHVDNKLYALWIKKEKNT